MKCTAAASKLRGACEEAGKGYVLAVPSSFQARLPSGRKIPVAALARLIPAAAWETRSCGPGCKGDRGPRLGVGRHLVAAALGADPPQPLRPF